MAEPTLEELAENVNTPNFGDDRLGVMFYTRTVEDPARSLEEGRKCFRDREYVKIMVPGDRHNTIDRPVQRTGNRQTDDTLRFSQQYMRFKNAQKQEMHDGTPLSMWPGISGSLVEELRYLNIFTVEQLATLADTHVAKIPMGQQYKAKAAEFVAASKDAAIVNKLQAQLVERDTRIDALEKAVADQAARIEKLLAKRN